MIFCTVFCVVFKESKLFFDSTSLSNEQIHSQPPNLTDLEPWNINFFGICVESCPTEGSYVCTDEVEKLVGAEVLSSGFTRDQVIEECINDPLVLVSPGLTSCSDKEIYKGCWETLFNTTSVLFRCLPSYVYNVER